MSFEENKEELENLISLLAQQADSRSTNLQVYFEDLNKEAEKREKKRWKWFFSIVTSVLVMFAVYVFEIWERQYDRLSCKEKEIAIIQYRIDDIDDHSVNKDKLQNLLSRLQRELEQGRSEEIRKLREEINRRIKEACAEE